MSDYFGALMRASGLLAAGTNYPRGARETPPPALEEAAAETRVMATADQPSPGAPAAPTPIPALASAPAPAAVDGRTGIPSATAAPATSAAQPQTSPQTSIQRVHAAAAASPSPMSAPAQASVPSAAQPPAPDGVHRDGRADRSGLPFFPDPGSPPILRPETDTSAPDRVSAGPSRIRAALQWIAADPHSVDPGNTALQRTPPVDSALPPWPTGPSLADGPSAPHSPPALLERTDTAPVRSHAIEAWLREPALPSQASRRVGDQDDAGGGLVEVSIGAIHVRVDAPPAQTRLAPPAPAAAAQRAPNRPASRDAVARRLLRRI